MTIKEFMAIESPLDSPDSRITENRPAVVCEDGFYISVQGSFAHYCAPRENNVEYTKVECGYPSTDDVAEIIDYAEDYHFPTASVFAYVPIESVQALLDRHGGIDVSKTLERIGLKYRSMNPSTTVHFINELRKYLKEDE